ncbi:glycosyltransferase [Gramella lutea]|uniref:Glycosyltransferase n=1 Tax=Christiangramia lutea TaxID=1607951 RepID=A0A9X1UZX6_9FLAO|nr:glycosyltransferase [Christiangramia lutea]MCH4821565.1 glycosyltransferase [Christiangramia lutea]
MRLAVFTHAEHYLQEGTLSSYSPYVREMNLWFEHVENITVIAPVKDSYDRIDKAYERSDIQFLALKTLNFTSFTNSLNSVIKLPGIIFRIFKIMLKADHLHIRCPGNIGLLACFLQIFFPGKSKTVKYAGNWDNESLQPWSYKLQKLILANEFLTRNARVLVYGDWPDQGRNVSSFFTSSFSNSSIGNFKKDFNAPFNFLFLGALTKGKRPLLAVKIVQALLNKGHELSLDIYGDGEMFNEVNDYITKNDLENEIILHGNQNFEIIKEAYRKAHFSILPSKSEGWPKALAEAMFFGCVPIGTPISCVPWMLGNGERGILIEPEVVIATEKIAGYLRASHKLSKMSYKAQAWSQKYTLEKLSSEIKGLL